MSRLLALSNAACFALAASAAQIPPGYEAVPITSGEWLDRLAHLNNRGQIVFERLAVNGWPSDEVFLYDNGALIRLTDDSVSDRMPDINDEGRVVWIRGLGPQGPYWPTYEIVVRSEGNMTRLTHNALDDYAPSLNSVAHIAWDQYTSSPGQCPTGEIFYFDSVTIRQITNDTPLVRQPQTAVINEGGEIVWTRYNNLPQCLGTGPWESEIMRYAGGQTARVSLPMTLQPQVPSINDRGSVAWDYGSGWGRHGIEVWDNGVITQLTDWGGVPNINNRGDIVFHRWYESPGQYGNYQVWLYRDGQFRQVTFDYDVFWNIPTDINDRGEFVYMKGTIDHTQIIYVRRIRGDLDYDGDVDLVDFSVFQLCFGGSNNPPAPTCPPDMGPEADLDFDNDVDLADFLIFQQNFTGSL